MSNVEHAASLVEAFIANRDKLDALKKEYDAAKAPLEQLQERIELALQKIMEESNLDNLKVAAGTASPHTKTAVAVANWEEVLGFIREHQLWHLLNKAVNKTAVEEYMKENQDIPPPGVNYQVFRGIQIRRARTTK